MNLNVNVYMRDLLTKVAKREGLLNPVIDCHGKVKNGEGFSGDVYYVSIKDKGGSSKLELAVKQSNSKEQVRGTFPIHSIYQNESYFYLKIWPAFNGLQKEKLESPVFDKIAKCYATDLQKHNECLVLENLRMADFVTIDKNEFFDTDHVKCIFETYGKFHGLSFAYKAQYPKKFAEFGTQLFAYWENATKIDLFHTSIETALNTCAAYFPKESSTYEKISNYAKNYLQLFRNCLKYNGKNGVILHGDCWTNNLMFKYEVAGDIKDLRLIDFQESGHGSVVYDLSYSLYAGSSIEVFDELKHYLRIYHNSLVKTCTALDCKKYISFEELMDEWKEYSRFGYIMALLLLKSKLTKCDKGLSEIIDTYDKNEDIAEMAQTDEVFLKIKVMELTNHIIERKFL